MPESPQAAFPADLRHHHPEVATSFMKSVTKQLLRVTNRLNPYMMLTVQVGVSSVKKVMKMSPAGLRNPECRSQERVSPESGKPPMVGHFARWPVVRLVAGPDPSNIDARPVPTWSHPELGLICEI
jgi:hypothetical protein